MFSVSSNALLSGHSKFFRKFGISGFSDHRLGTGCELVIRWLENCIAYSFFCILTIITIIVSSSSSICISIYFVVLSNCITTHEFSLLSISPANPTGVEGGKR